MTTSDTDRRETLPAIEKAGLGGKFFGTPTPPQAPAPTALPTIVDPAIEDRSAPEAPPVVSPRRSRAIRDARRGVDPVKWDKIVGGSVTAYVPPEIATRFREAARGVGLSQAVAAGQAVDSVSVDAIKKYCQLDDDTTTTDMPGARRISAPRDTATLQIRMRPDQRAWLEEKKPHELDHLPSSRWLGAAITIHFGAPNASR